MSDANPSELSLKQLITDIALGLQLADKSGAQAKRWQAGIGPFDEKPAMMAAIQQLVANGNNIYRSMQFEVAYPGDHTKEKCDLVLPNLWAVEVKQVRPFGDNGQEARDWLKNILYPYPVHEGLLGDCHKLIRSGFQMRKAVIAYGFEHIPATLPLNVAVEAFEILAQHLTWVDFELGRREEVSIPNLIHPIHQQLRLYGWEVH